MTIAGGRIREGMEDNWARAVADVAHRSSWPIHAGVGPVDAAVTYFEIDAGKRIGRHEHDASETVLLLEGEGRAVVGSDEKRIAAGDVVHVPAGVVHDVVNEGNLRLELVGFFTAATVTTTFEDVQMPEETKELGTPD